MQPPDYKKLYKELSSAQVKAVRLLTRVHIETEVKVIKPYEKWERAQKSKEGEKV